VKEPFAREPYSRLVRLVCWIIAAELAAIVGILLWALLSNRPLAPPQVAPPQVAPPAAGEAGSRSAGALPALPSLSPRTLAATPIAPLPTPRPEGVWVEPALPAGLSAAVQDWLTGQAGRLVPADPGAAAVTVGWQAGEGAGPLAELVLAPVVPFSSLRGGIQAGELRRAWLGRSRPGEGASRWLVTGRFSTLKYVPA